MPLFEEERTKNYCDALFSEFDKTVGFQILFRELDQIVAFNFGIQVFGESE